MKVLCTAFNGKTNSSKVLLDTIINVDKLYLKNSFNTSVIQLEEKISNNDYDLVISFGQALIDKDTIKIETKAILGEYYETNYDYSELENELKKHYNVVVSENAGNYLCNNVYYHGLKYISGNKLKTKMIFIHIPKMKNITDVKLMASILNSLIIMIKE